jgi:phosphoglycerate dehydrogenase-like enzyme
VPATPETYHLIGTEKLQMMKRGAILVNTARGSLIDSDALLAALNSGQISHALLDVLEHEHDLELSRELIQHPRVVVTPHIAFYADDSLGNMYRISLQSIREWLEGKTPEYNVNLEQAAASIKA